MFRRSDPLQFVTQIGGKKLAEDIKSSDKEIRRYEGKFGAKKRRSSLWQSPGAVLRVLPYDRGVRLACDHGWIELHWAAPDCLRVRLNTENGDFLPPFSYAVSKVDWPVVPVEKTDGEDVLEIRSTGFVCRVNKRQSRLRLEMPDGRLLASDAAGMQWQPEGSVRLSVGIAPQEACYGLGMRASSLNLRGKRFQLWNADPGAYARNTDPLYLNIPFYIGMHEGLAYGVFWDNSCRGTADLSATKPGELAFESEGGELRYYIFTGPDVHDVLARFTELTGRIKLPPLWALGYQQARFSYQTQEEVLAVAAEFRNRNIPCDLIYLDIHHRENFRSFTWSRDRFYSARSMIEQLHANGFKVAAAVEPAIQIDPQYDSYRGGVARDVFLKYPDNHPVVGASWAGASHFPDFTKPITRTWWWEQFSLLVRFEVDGIFTDRAEPSVMTPDGKSGTLPDFVQHNRDGLGGDHLENHNTYSLLANRATLEGMEKQRVGQRQWILTRSGFAGIQRYAAVSMGENASDWDQLRLSISMALNMGLSGVAMAGADVGGFHKEASGELFTRWMQAACLMPVFRGSAFITSKPHEPWAFGQPYELINRTMIQLRYRLLPYLYSVIAQSREYGWPVIRPLFMAEPNNPALVGLDDAFMVGGAMLVAPVVEEGAISRDVYLPQGEWYDFWSNEPIAGGRKITVPAPLERLPIFVRAGTVLPIWPDVRYIGETSIEALTLRVYPGDFETVLYEDAGESLDYEKGGYRWVYLSCAWEDENKLVVNRRVAGGYKPEYSKIRVEIIGLGEEPAEVRVNRRGAPLWFYDDGVLEITADDGLMSAEVTGQPSSGDRTLVRRPW
jgi:alpha-glucosidase